MFEPKPATTTILDDDGKPLPPDIAHILTVYEKLGQAGRKKVMEAIDEQLELQQLREQAAKPQEKKVTVIETIEKVGEKESIL
jgi:hypothetical protein